MKQTAAPCRPDLYPWGAGVTPKAVFTSPPATRIRPTSSNKAAFTPAVSTHVDQNVWLLRPASDRASLRKFLSPVGGST